MRVFQLNGDTRLSVESGSVILICDQMLVENLKGNLSVLAGVICPVNGAPVRPRRVSVRD